MTTDEAAKLLNVAPDVTPEQLETRFNELRARLEDKLAKAPTPGLKDKYRRSLEDITKAFEMLVLAADASTLPVLQRVESARPAAPAAAASATTSAAGTPPPPAPAAPATKKKSGNKEFVLVALLAIVVLGGGGWWVVKTRAEKAEQRRFAAEAKAAAEAAAEAAAAAQKKKAAQLSIELATAKVAWDALENSLRDAERRTSEAKSELRGFRDGPAWKRAELSARAHRHELYSTWLSQYLARHPARIARAKAEQLLNDQIVDEAADAVAEMKQELDELEGYVPERARRMLEGTSDVVIESKPEGVSFVFTDPYGRTIEGVTPAKLNGQPLSHLHDPKFDGDAGDTEILVGEFSVEPTVRFIRSGWKDVVETGRTSLEGGYFSAEFAEGALEITSDPSGLQFTVTQNHTDLGWTASGTAPATVTGVPVGDVKVTIERPGYGRSWQNLAIKPGETVRTLPLGVKGQEVSIAVAESHAKIFVDKKLAGQGQATVRDLMPGEHSMQIEAAGYLPYRATFKSALSNENPLVLRYNIKELAVENVNCPACGASGIINRVESCVYCGGRGWERCGTCGDDGYEWVDPGFFAGGPYKQRCSACKGTKRRPCGFFGRGEQQCSGDGTARWREACARCSGDGRVSKLQLSQ